MPNEAVEKVANRQGVGNTGVLSPLPWAVALDSARPARSVSDSNSKLCEAWTFSTASTLELSGHINREAIDWSA
jgi:hypothetical protein